MHFSASVVLRLHDVCPSMTLVDQDHIGGKSWKLIARKHPNTSALRSPKAIHLLRGEPEDIWGSQDVGWENVACWSNISAALDRPTLPLLQILNGLLFGWSMDPVNVLAKFEIRS